MNCPACNKTLNDLCIDDIKLDVCEDGCGGIWFDNKELEKLDEPHEFAEDTLTGILRLESEVDSPSDQKYSCPKCRDIVMMRYFSSTKREIEIDHCPNCGGHWLDAGELFRIRNEFKTAEAREQAAKETYREIYDFELAKLKLESKQKAEKAGRIAGLLSFIFPRFSRLTFKARDVKPDK